MYTLKRQGARSVLPLTSRIAPAQVAVYLYLTMLAINLEPIKLTRDLVAYEKIRAFSVWEGRPAKGALV